LNKRVGYLRESKEAKTHQIRKSLDLLSEVVRKREGHLDRKESYTPAVVLQDEEGSIADGGTAARQHWKGFSAIRAGVNEGYGRNIQIDDRCRDLLVLRSLPGSRGAGIEKPFESCRDEGEVVLSGLSIESSKLDGLESVFDRFCAGGRCLMQGKVSITKLAREKGSKDAVSQ
jgi:hypothetical protein